MPQEDSERSLQLRMEAAGIIKYGNFQLNSGKANTKVEFDVINDDPALLKDVSYCAAEILEPYNLDALLSNPDGATPSGELIAKKLGVYHIPAKKTTSGISLQSPIVNTAILRPKKRIGIWDDVLSTGNTIVESSNLQQIVGKVVVAAVVWDRRELYSDRIPGANFPVVSLVHDFVPFWTEGV